ncbi:MAG: NAD(P)/FAD-dependent oxidoreductase [Alphaproteobacteria bacterium]|nr:NAD(P)/FAD-dependent oxidoreductase [Alphaproteobacteria bacterium]
MSPLKPSVLCIGAGPAGLTAAYHLTKSGIPVTVLERDPVNVGGISRTETYKGFRFDIGGHRFFSKSAEIEALWQEILGDQFIDRPRKSRIFYRGKLFDYPLRAVDALLKLGIFESFLCMASYARARLLPTPSPRNFEQWVTNQFGARLFGIFFRTYTEKVWGMKCSEISADWAAQRIKGLSLGKAVWHALVPKKLANRGETVKTLIDSFRYPRLGPGQMWETAAHKVEQGGGRVLRGHSVTGLARAADGKWTVTATDGEGRDCRFEADHVISSAAIRDLAAALQPVPPVPVKAAADDLKYRDFLTVALVVKDRGRFDDNWIYIHEPGVKVGRIQNFKSWSPELVPDAALNCYGLEYFCFEGDNLWTSADADLIDLAKRELVQLGLAAADEVVDGHVIRQPKAYPVYDDAYQQNVDVIRAWIERDAPGLHLVGRNGMHKYNNQDHAMMTALLTAENILAGHAKWDVWQVNQDAEYHEAGEDRGRALSERLVPARA